MVFIFFSQNQALHICLYFWQLEILFMRRFPFFSLLFIVIIFSCKTVHKTRTRVEGVRTPRAELLEKLQHSDFDYKWFYAKAKIEYDDSRNNQTINAIIKMKKDSVIWISLNAILGIEVSRILITPDSVKLMDKYNKRYYKRDFNYLKQIIHMPNMTFDVLQKTITGSVLSFDKSNVQVEKNDSSYTLETSENQIQSVIWLNALNLTMSKKQLKNKVINQSYEMNYSDYRLLADRLFSYKRKVKIESKQSDNYTIDMDYNKVILNEPQKFPFTVSDKYEVVK